MSNVVPALGSTSLGIVIGWLVRYFIRRFQKFTPAVFSAVISIILGGVVVKFLGTDPNVWWFYPIGLLLGFVAYQVIVMVLLRERPPVSDPASVDFTPRYPPPRRGGRDKDEPRFLDIK
jgi:hypothetical protein